MIKWFQSLLPALKSLAPLYNVAGGVTEFYAAVFTVVSIVLAFKSLLTPAFVGVIGAIQTLITVNDVHNDLHK